MKKQTIGERYGPVFDIKTKEEAKIFFDNLISTAMENHPDWDKEYCISVERSNLLYYSGYFDKLTRDRLIKVFNL